MGKDLFKATESDSKKKFEAEVSGQLGDGKAANAVMQSLVAKKVKDTQAKLTEIAINAVEKIKILEEECKKAQHINPNVQTVTEEGVTSSVYSKEVYDKKMKPFNELEKLNKAFDVAMSTGTIEDFEKLEKLLK